VVASPYMPVVKGETIPLPQM